MRQTARVVTRYLALKLCSSFHVKSRRLVHQPIY